jgi:hypothetical protein
MSGHPGPASRNREASTRWDVDNAATSIILIDERPVDLTSDPARDALLDQLHYNLESQAGWDDADLAIRHYADVCF